MALEVGSRLGHYDVAALIGEGGMGQVYRATDTRTSAATSLSRSFYEAACQVTSLFVEALTLSDTPSSERAVPAPSWGARANGSAARCAVHGPGFRSLG